MTNTRDLRVIISYKNFAASSSGISHIGLGVAALNNVRWLQAIGIRAEVLALKEPDDLRKFLNIQRSENQPPVTHVVVSAPWIKTEAYRQLVSMFPMIQFAVNCHSNVGFLQADTNGVELLRQGLNLQSETYNFRVAGNSKRFCRFIYDAYGDPCSYLPNMYFLNGTTAHRPTWPVTRGVLRLGIFGATRTLKNMGCATAAAIEISRELKAQVEIWVNTQRDDGPETKRILRSVRAMIAGLPNITLKEAGWRSWPDFRKLVGNMHLCILPSHTESFNMCCADAVAEGVPSVVSSAITWVPKGWKADADDVFDIARVGIQLINDPLAAVSGYRALGVHNRDGLRAWLKFLDASDVDQTRMDMLFKHVHQHDAGDFGV